MPYPESLQAGVLASSDSSKRVPDPGQTISPAMLGLKEPVPDPYNSEQAISRAEQRRRNLAPDPEDVMRSSTQKR